MRHFDDWILGYQEYAKYSEAPLHMHFWTAVSTIAGALRRQVWIDMGYFQWFPNFYIIIVSPPGIVGKSTTSGLGMNLLRKVPDINFGPEVATWPALIDAFSDAQTAFEYQGEFHPQSAITLEASELGNLLNPQDRDMVDLLVTLWDGKQGKFEKKTKHSGNNLIENPWINLIACTTPAWIAGNFPDSLIGGGFTSRCVFVYAEKKRQLVAYPNLLVKNEIKEIKEKLVEDLHRISQLKGEFRLTDEAYEWGTQWYASHNTAGQPAHLDSERFGGYLARKQTHVHKLAMVLSAAQGDDLVITKHHLQVAVEMVTDLEPDMSMVFSKIGKADSSVYADRLREFVDQRGKVPYTEAYRYIHVYFPKFKDFEDILAGLIRSGYIRIEHEGSNATLISTSRPPKE